ncbi:MAG TPA: histidine kinase [Longimicrobiales bacterium]|nr:histidine kinase [Longimicrobiales bacterium]
MDDVPERNYDVAMNQERHRQFWLETALIFAAWTVFGLFMANQFYMQGSALRGAPVPWGPGLKQGLFEAYQWAFVTLAIFWLARRFPLERGRLIRRIPMHLAGALVLAMARVVAMVEASRHVDWLGTRDFNRQYYSWYHNYVLFCVLLIGIAHAVVYYARYRERERAAERLAAGLTEARLQALKMQLQPHFLFNTLNAISALIPADAKPARRMIARLGDLLRISLEHEETQEVTLREELAFLEPYLEIEQARLGDRLVVVLEIAPDTLDALVPHLMLQPLVENAIRHGIAPRIEAGTVTIASALGADGGSLHLEVRDDGPGIVPDGGASGRKGVGLSNIRSRLEQLYDGAHRFELDTHPEGGLIVRIVLPFRGGGLAEGLAESSVR